MQTVIDERTLSKLRWRCRRGMLENDLFVERFFMQHGAAITVQQARGLEVLMDLGDNDLLDLFLGRKEPVGDLQGDGVMEVLRMMRTSQISTASSVRTTTSIANFKERP